MYDTRRCNEQFLIVSPYVSLRLNSLIGRLTVWIRDRRKRPKGATAVCELLPNQKHQI